MALTDLQRRVCRILADRRIASGEQYVAGGLALNEALGGTRISRDVDLFHDTDEALAVSSEADCAALARAGFSIESTRRLIDTLPPTEVGRAVLDHGGAPFRGDAQALASALDAGTLRFHAGSIRGALPTVRPRT